MLITMKTLCWDTIKPKYLLIEDPHLSASTLSSIAPP